MTKVNVHMQIPALSSLFFSVQTGEPEGRVVF